MTLRHYLIQNHSRKLLQIRIWLIDWQYKYELVIRTFLLGDMDRLTPSSQWLILLTMGSVTGKDGWAAMKNACLPAPVLKTQQSSHDMMPIIVRLPTYDVIKNIDDFLLITTTVIHMYTCIYMYVCVSFLLRVDKRNTRNWAMSISYSVDDQKVKGWRKEFL